MPAQSPSNFDFLQPQHDLLARLGILAEKYLAQDDPNTCLLKLRQFGELLAQTVAGRMGLLRLESESQYDLLRRLQDENVISREIYWWFGEIRKVGNDASHGIRGNRQSALNMIKVAWQLGVWFQRSFVDAQFEPVDFVEPLPASRVGLDWERFPQFLREAGSNQYETSIATSQDERDLAQAQADVLHQLIALQPKAGKKKTKSFEQYRAAAQQASQRLHLDEAATRQLIDAQLRQAGWDVDTVNLRYSNGTRPQKGRNLAIAEWPTASGPADYVFFVGLMPIAVVEAKRKNVDVSTNLQQAKRYSRDFQFSDEMQPPAAALNLTPDTWNPYHIPFAFSSNGRPYLKQLETKSGIWFIDLRHPQNLGHVLDGWYTPEGLKDLLKRDVTAAEKELIIEPFNYGFPLRYYQKDAICAVEQGLRDGRREMLVAMATGTGKTKTCIALIYRLLNVKRFKRVLFLVDREALGEQAANAFKDTRMDSIQSFADIFGIKELEAQTPDSDTAVHIATVQGMVRRVLFPGDQTPPTVDQYDCIIVDECHRGYMLDRELSETEITFRNFEDYVSKYRRVINYFDAIKIGLTATPALHTTEIFGSPIYNYPYREAVIDGYLIDHEPPIQLTTELSTHGITWQAGETVKMFDPVTSQVVLVTLPDEITLEVEAFNRKVVTKAFNRVVCKYLAAEIDPDDRRKTLIFCVNDGHADLVVDLLKQEFRAQYGGVQDDAVIKITGTADQPLQLIRRYKNEHYPTVAVTVDLLTTGVDVPEICNIVFLRRVNSRILYEQMMGRATRLCPDVGKETFRIFDAVRLYEAMQTVSNMKPVVVDPKLSFTQLLAEMGLVTDEIGKELIREQFLAKFQRKKQRLSEQNARDFETVTGMNPDTFIHKLKETPIHEIADWFTENPMLGEILDRVNPSQQPIFISEHPDELLGVEHGYGHSTQPQDYLQEFKEYIQNNRDTIPALLTVLTRPRELTRKQLRELALQLDRAGFSETNITTAWREMTNQEIAANIVGFIRHLATGDPLVPYEQRVDWALSQMLAARPWTTPQREWLKKIALQTRVNKVVDRDALDDPDLIFKREGGGFPRLDKMFDGRLAETLDEFHDLLWKPQTH